MKNYHLSLPFMANAYPISISLSSSSIESQFFSWKQYTQLKYYIYQAPLYLGSILDTVLGSETLQEVLGFLKDFYIPITVATNSSLLLSSYFFFFFCLLRHETGVRAAILWSCYRHKYNSYMLKKSENEKKMKRSLGY